MNRWLFFLTAFAAFAFATSAIVSRPASGQQSVVDPGSMGQGIVGGDEAGPPGTTPGTPSPVEADSKTSSSSSNGAAEGSNGRMKALIASLTIFVLAIFVGFEMITKVPPTLHTPLMSGSNAISGITIVGALLVTGTAFGVSSTLGFIAVILATINVVGGFLVTHRMLAMFRKR